MLETDSITASTEAFVQGPVAAATAAVSTWPYPIVLAVLCLLALLAVGSGAMAASWAEERHRAPLGHFLLGLGIPVLYPLLVRFVFGMKGEKGKRRKKEKEYQRENGAPPVGLPPATQATGDLALVDEASLSKDDPFDEAYFRRVWRDNAGNHRGPFLLVVGDHDLRVERIVEVLPHCIVCETGGGSGTQKLRVPYAKVVSCKEI